MHDSIAHAHDWALDPADEETTMVVYFSKVSSFENVLVLRCLDPTKFEPPRKANLSNLPFMELAFKF
jgi:hypothetical protein